MTKILNVSTASIRVYRDAEELALKAARSFARLADQYVLGCGRFTVALAGGSTPKAMFEMLAAEPFFDTVPWSSIRFFWGDERRVPPDHPESNFRMANKTLLSKVPVLRENIFRIPADHPKAEEAANLYAATLAREVDALNGFPCFDLVMLGMGADGHTASLFPGTSALKVADRAVVANPVERLQTVRITLTASAINSAHNVRFLVSGDNKAEALKQVLQGPPNAELFPSQLIDTNRGPNHGSLLWMIDEGAASLLTAN